MKRRVDPSLYTRDYFEAHCRGQDRLTDLRAGELHEIFLRALRAAGIKGGERVADYGCGRGELVYHCARTGCEVTGIDVSDAALEMVRETIRSLPEEARQRIELRAASVEEIELAEGVYDVIFMVDVLEHLNLQTPGSLKRRLTRYGFKNRVACVDPSKNLLSLIFRRWAGRTIDALAVK